LFQLNVRFKKKLKKEKLNARKWEIIKKSLTAGNPWANWRLGGHCRFPQNGEEKEKIKKKDQERKRQK
jgi:hypothetical protein